MMRRWITPAIALIATAAPALSKEEEFIQTSRIENGWQTGQAINVETGAIQSSPAAAGWLSAQWELLPSEVTYFDAALALRMRTIRNAWTKEYLNYVPDKYKALAQPGFYMGKSDAGAVWYIDPVPGYPGYYRIESISKGNFLHVEHGKLEVGPIQPGWQSAWWKLPNYTPFDYATPRKIANQKALAEFDRDAALEEAQRQIKAAELQEQMRRRQAQAQADARRAEDEQYAAIEAAKANQDESLPLAAPNGRGLSNLTGNGSGTTRWVTAAPNRPITNYDVDIDFCHSSLTDTDTSDTLTVEFIGADGSAGTKTVQGSGACSVFGAAVSTGLHVTLDTYLDVSSVKISTNGSNAFFIDQVHLYRNGTKIVWDGRTDGGGWCLSLDPNDYQGGWQAVVASCSASYTFSSRVN